MAVVGDGVGASARSGAARRRRSRIVCRGREWVPGPRNAAHLCRACDRAVGEHGCRPNAGSRGSRKHGDCAGIVPAGGQVREWLDRRGPRLSGSPAPARRGVAVLGGFRNPRRRHVAGRLAAAQERRGEKGRGDGLALDLPAPNGRKRDDAAPRFGSSQSNLAQDARGRRGSSAPTPDPSLVPGPVVEEALHLRGQLDLVAVWIVEDQEWLFPGRRDQAPLRDVPGR